MYLGRIVEVGDTEVVLSDPQHPYTRALLSVVPARERRERQILAGEPPDPGRVPSGCRFHPRCPLVASGEAARRGIVDRCIGIDPALEASVESKRGPSVGGHVVACHAIAVPPG